MGVSDSATIRGHGPATTAWAVLVAISLCHLINDVMQSMLAAIYPLLRQEFALSYWQIGMMTFAFQVTASLLQPVVGAVTDRRPMPKSLSVGMGSTFAGVLLLALAHDYWMLLVGAMLIGIGSAVFHPESSRVARIASGLDQARVACALERCRLARKAYPETLPELAPAFLPQVPHDLVTGAPLRYARTGEGFRLHSVGWNGTDEGGSRAKEPTAGDWVWSSGEPRPPVLRRGAGPR